MSEDERPSSIPLDYLTPAHGGDERSRLPVVAAIDVVAVIVTIGYALAFVDACQINLQEAPMNGGGSAYVDSAACNEQWQKDHPKLAAFVRNIPTPGCGLAWLIPHFATCGTLPYVTAGVLLYRTWAVRKAPFRRIVITPMCILLLVLLPWVDKAMIVIGD
jgi:hypothetical protein